MLTDLDGGLRVQHVRFAAAMVGVGVLAACGAPTERSEPGAAADPQRFCEQLAAIEQAPPELGGNNAEGFTALLDVSEAGVADDVETLRDYHRDVYVEGDPDTDTYDRLPDDVREAVHRLDAYADQHCEGYTAEFD
jgi:hypothetical protein